MASTTALNHKRDKLTAPVTAVEDRRREIATRYGDVGVEAFDALEEFRALTESSALHHYYDLGKTFLAIAERLPADANREVVLGEIAADSYTVVGLTMQMARLFDDDDMVALTTMRSQAKGTIESGGQEVSQRMSWGIVKCVIPLHDRAKIFEALEAWKTNAFASKQMHDWVTDTFGMTAGGKVAGAREVEMAGAPMSKLKALKAQANKAAKVVHAAKQAFAALRSRTGDFGPASYKLVVAVERELDELYGAVPVVLDDARQLLAAIADDNPAVIAAVRKTKKKKKEKVKPRKKTKEKPARAKRKAKVAHVDDDAEVDRIGAPVDMVDDEVVDEIGGEVAVVGGPAPSRSARRAITL